MTKEQTYQRAREASEKIKQDAYAAANQLAVDCIDTADATMRKDPFNLTARAAREHACSVASDARAGMYAEAERRHANRMAAIQPAWPKDGPMGHLASRGVETCSRTRTRFYAGLRHPATLRLKA
jgi:hypothetical protein